MRTIDAQAYIQQKMAAEIARYPAGSVSKRDVIYQLDTADEATYGKLDAALTKLVYDEAAKAAASRIPAKYSSEVIRLTALAQASLQQLLAPT